MKYCFYLLTGRGKFFNVAVFSHSTLFFDISILKRCSKSDSLVLRKTRGNILKLKISELKLINITKNIYKNYSFINKILDPRSLAHGFQQHCN